MEMNKKEKNQAQQKTPAEVSQINSSSQNSKKLLPSIAIAVAVLVALAAGIGIYHMRSTALQEQADLCAGNSNRQPAGEMSASEPAVVIDPGKEEEIKPEEMEVAVTDNLLSEAELHAIFVEKIGNTPEAYFFYDDFDGDGIHEAYGIAGNYSDGDELYLDVMIYYISPDGTCYCPTEYDDIYGYLTLMLDDPQGTLLQVGRHKFLLWELSANGSGSETCIFGADKGMPYEPEISRRYMRFGMQSDFLAGDGVPLSDVDTDTYVGYISDFSQGYHDYIPHYFMFDEEELQFVEK